MNRAILVEITRFHATVTLNHPAPRNACVDAAIAATMPLFPFIAFYRLFDAVQVTTAYVLALFPPNLGLRSFAPALQK